MQLKARSPTANARLKRLSMASEVTSMHVPMSIGTWNTDYACLRPISSAVLSCSPQVRVPLTPSSRLMWES